MQRNRHHAIGKGVIILFIVLGSICVPITVITNEFHPIVIESGSMEPVLNIGDAVFIQQQVDYSKVNVGQDGDILVIANSSVFLRNGVPMFVYDNIDNETPIIHRAVEKFMINGTYYFVTKGDSNPYPDGCVKYVGSPNKTYCIIEYNISNPVLIPEKYIIGKVIFTIPLIGFFKIWSWQIYFHIIVLIGILFIYTMKKKRSKQ
ncbi:MAG TPA: hypothetical protein VKM55_03480 [Candidatus Lokiarchaeia archaeon]|nr:hypothetical protein [Candidatus Lokiarchaeia archaeon]